MTVSNSPRKKLIEVALPLVAINAASAREKSIRHGHPSTLHLWWARRPLAAARAVIFAQMVDDPSAWPDLYPTEKAQEKERARLFHIIEELVKWENTTNETVLQQARDEIWQSWRRACAENAGHPHAKELFDRHRLPAFHDPFAGGGALPLEAQRLGLEAYASDLNPVAVLINKAMIEIPPKFAGRPPVNPISREDAKHGEVRGWKGTQGLAEDVRYYGQWMRDEAEKRIGHLYPKIDVTASMVAERPDLQPYAGQKLTVIAWIWTRTVKSPNPAFAQVDVPLASTFMLATKPGKEAYVEATIMGADYRFTVNVGKPKNIESAKNGTKLARGANFKCLLSGTPIVGDYIKAEGMAGRMASRLMAIVAEGNRERVYLSPTERDESIARQANPGDAAAAVHAPIAYEPRALWCLQYGFDHFDKLFSSRQLIALTTFSDLVEEARERVKREAKAAGLVDDGKPLDSGGAGATAYADGIGVYLGCAVSRMANYSSTLCVWSSHGKDELAKQVFMRQGLPMTWDFAETNPFSSAGGALDINIQYLKRAIDGLSGCNAGVAYQANATQVDVLSRVVSTDPPYYDNIGYADLSDFFYVWLRRSLRSIFPDLFATLTVPKAEELIAATYRHGGKESAELFFLAGMTQAMHRLAERVHPVFPVTIYYAFKQSESDRDTGTASTGWDTFLEAVISAGFAITGTWPMRTELIGNLKREISALASSIILVCRPRAVDAPAATRRDFVAALKAELPASLRHLQAGNIAPVDLAQAAIGPGMGVYTRYARVLDAAGKPVSVREALALINATLDEALAEQEGDFDADSRWALAWFEQNGFAEGEYGVAETLSKAKNTSVAGLAEAHILDSRRGRVRLLKPEELPADWDPATDPRLTAWEVVHHLIRALGAGGEAAAADLVAKLGVRAEAARELAYRLYTLCERKKRAAEALAYNGLVQSWPEISRLARETPRQTAEPLLL
jgi:putative DNA methylase